MNRKVAKYIPILILVALQACKSDSCFQADESYDKMQIPLEYCDELNVSGIFHVILVPDSQDYVEFETYEAVFPHLEAEVRDSTLWLENLNDCFYQRDHEKVKAWVHYSHVTRLNVFEASKVTNEMPIEHRLSVTIQTELAEIDLLLDNNEFYFYNNTTTGGRYTFRGSTDRSRISCYYTGQFNLENLRVRDLRANNHSIGDITVWAEEKLTVQISDRGDIYYKGNPEVVVDSIWGSGSLLPVE